MDPQNFKSGHSTYRLSTPNLTFFLVGTGVWVQSFALLSRHANIWAMPLNLKFEKLQNMDYFECVHDTTCGNSTLVLMWWVIVEMQVHWWFFKIKLINEFCLNLASSPRYLKYSRIKKKKKKESLKSRTFVVPSTSHVSFSIIIKNTDKKVHSGAWKIIS
jgi:hypothetical protein